MIASKVKTVLFARVSSREQEESGYSLPSQEKLLREYADKNGLSVAKSFSISESASGKSQRETFKKMIAYADLHGVKIIVCEKADRLTRTFKDMVRIDAWLDEDPERRIHLVKDSLILHRDSKSQEKLNWGIRILFAKNYIDNLSEEVKKGQKEKIAQGWLPTKPPLGYKTIGEKGHKMHVIDEEKAPLVKRMFELYATGNYSLMALVKRMNAEGLRNAGGTKLARSRVHELLSDPFYYGTMRWKEELFEGKHEPLINKAMFNAVQARLARKHANPLYRKHLPVFKAMIECVECHGTITWEIQKGNWYGHCNHYRDCSQKKYVRQELVEKQLYPYFDKVAPIHRDVLGILEKALKESQSDEIEYNENKRGTLTRIIATADQRMAAAYRDRLDGAMPLEICQKVIDESNEEKKSALHELERLRGNRNAYYEAGLAIHELALEAYNIYQSPKATIEDKRLLLSHMFTRHTMKEGLIQPNYTFAFEFLGEWMPKVNTSLAQTENASEAIASQGVSVVPSNESIIGALGASKDFRTSRKRSVKTRHGHTAPISRPLLPG